MQVCPKCNEVNGENRSTCFKCNAFLGKVSDTYHKKCMKCGTVYSSKIDVCERCHSNLVVVHNASSVQYEGGSGNGILCVVSLLFPLIGFILGLIYIAKDDGDQGKMFMFLGVISCVITAIMLALIVN